MKLTIEFESEWWRVEAWWYRTLCDWFGHPGWEEPKEPSGMYVFSHDPRPRCVRCHTPDPTRSPPKDTVTVTFTDTAYVDPDEDTA